MAAETKIQWCDHTLNPWSGCSKVHLGCTNCYAEVNYSVKMRGVNWGPNGTRVRASDSMWKEPLKWNAGAAKEPFVCRRCGTRYFCESGGSPECEGWKCDIVPFRPRVFCASLADVFEDWRGPMLAADGGILHTCNECGARRTMEKMCHGPNAHFPLTMDDCRRDLFALIDATPNLDWLILTKRPENVRRMWPTVTRFVPDALAKLRSEGASLEKEMTYRPNVFLGTSISDQPTADLFVPRLLECRSLAPVLFLSAEPLLGPIELPLSLWHDGLTLARKKLEDCPSIDWTIIGGESGPKARPMALEWARSLVRQCQAAGVACFVKQLGAKPEWTVTEGGGFSVDPDPPAPARIPLPLDDKKGGDPEEWPADLRVRQMPK